MEIIILNKLNKKLALVGFGLSSLLILSGCVASEVNKQGIRVPTEAGKAGITYRFIVTPMINFVDLFAHNMALGYGMAIILVTLIIRLLILPLGLNQAYKSTYMQEKMAYLTPVFAPLNARLKSATTNEEKMAAQQALMQAQKDNGVNMLSSIGCLPLIIQWPFFIALYNASMYTPGIMSASFMGINLAKPSIILTIISGVLYFAQTWISTFGMTEEQKKTGRMMLIMSPAMIVVFSFMAPAAAALYWAVGGLVIVIQQVIITFIMKPSMKKKIDAEFKANPPKVMDAPKDVTPASVQESFKSLTNQDYPIEHKNHNGRNSGKQNRKS